MSESNNQDIPYRNIPNPRELMRARHPDLFSDTRIDDVFRLSKNVFEYHLDTLTSRKQEYEFEHFCRKLAEKEICPNLRVQTGPTGGGDSKVDSETYPVAEEIAERWWIGEPSAGVERWAFAFSAKKEWKPKVKADVGNILSTRRDYNRIYFFTNQFARDKERSNLEDTLSKQMGIPVHIFDRAWIVEKVYEAGHLELAIAALGIESAGSEKVSRPGPRDTARLAELEELDRQVADPLRYQGARYQLVEDCMRSAILARGLERPRSEVESRLAHADSLAQQLGYRPQQLRIAYNRAWTAFWWYEDYSTFEQFYEEVERYVEVSSQAHEVELLLNLWLLLPPSVATRQISPQDAKFETRRQTLAPMLEAIAYDSSRLNNALQARTGLTLMKITLAHLTRQSDQLESGWLEFAQIVDESDNLLSYPIERLFGLITEIGEHIDSLAYDSLYEKLATVIRKRRSDGAAGGAYGERGIQKLKQEKPYEAIRWFGKAEALLTKEEFQGELIMALIGSGYAYERVGLLWATRNKVLAAVERTLATFRESGEIVSQALLALRRLVWVELQLGRIPHILNAVELANFVASHLKLSAEQQDAYAEERWMQDGVLGIHMLNLPFDALSEVKQLPDTLESLGLVSAKMALLFALGHEQTLREEGYIPASENSDSVQSFFEQWQDQSAADDLPTQPVLVNGTTSLLKSIILGTEFIVETPNNHISFGIAESLLGALEAFLATSDEQDVMPHRECLEIVINVSDQFTGMPQLLFPDDDGGKVEIVHPMDFQFTTAAERRDYMAWLKDSFVQIMCRVLMIKDITIWLDKIAGEERGFSRALDFGDVFTLNSNVFGETPALCLTDWLKIDIHSYAVLRKESWREVNSTNSDESTRVPKFGTGPPPAELMDKEQLKHTERRVLSPIDTHLWDRAQWRAILFTFYAKVPPMLAIVFKDGEAGQAIFRAWKELWGEVDENDVLRLAIITGLSKRNPAEYAVVVGPNLTKPEKHEAKSILTVSRIHRMVPTNSTNLDNFIAAYKKAGTFLLAPGEMTTNMPTPFAQFAITKRQLNIRQAWEISENDPDICVLEADDEPIIPSGVVDPPVKKALEKIRSRKKAD